MYHVSDELMVPFVQIISLQQKHTHHVLYVHDAKSLQQFLLGHKMSLWRTVKFKCVFNYTVVSTGQ